MNATYSAEYRLLENEGIVDEEDEDDDEDVPPPENVVIQMPEEADQCCNTPFILLSVLIY